MRRSSLKLLMAATTMRSSSPKRDKSLLVLTSILNITSGCTTVWGAVQIFPGGIGILVGITIQLMLFLLLFGFGLRYAPLRKWLAVFVFSVMSVYLSFFAYYTILVGNIHQFMPGVRLLLPIQKLISGEPQAIVSALLASLLDGTVLLLSTSLEVKTHRQVIPLSAQRDENESLAEAYLRKLVRQAQLISILFIVVGILYLIAGWRIGFNIGVEIPLLLVCVPFILYARNTFLKYRINRGLYGNNYYEAKEVLAFLEKEYKGKGRPPGGGRNAFPEVASNNEISINDRIIGETT